MFGFDFRQGQVYAGARTVTSDHVLLTNGSFVEIGTCKMGDIGDYWRDLKDYTDRNKDYVSERRHKRVAKFQHNLEQIADLAKLYGIEIKSPDEWHHIQIKHGNYIGNYYPSTRKFFFQRPVLTPTQRDIAPEDVLLIFLKHALQIESFSAELYNA